jgi:hypothetical protein
MNRRFQGVVTREREKREKALLQIRFRRINWRHVGVNRLKTEIEKYLDLEKSVEHPFDFWLSYDNTDVNAESFRVVTTRRYTGIIRHITEKVENGDVKRSRELEIENACQLVFSQAYNGTIGVFLYPHSAKSHERKEDCIVLYFDLDPLDLTPKLIGECYTRFLRYSRLSSILESRTFHGRIDYWWLLIQQLKDIRSRRKVNETAARFAVEWGKIIMPALVALWLGKEAIEHL